VVVRLTLRVSILVIVSCAGSGAVALSAPAARRAFTIPDFYRLKVVADPRISPDGRRVAYSVRETDLPRATSRTNLWIADLATGAAAPLTNASSANTSPRWSPDGRSIAFVSNRGGEDQVWTVSMSPSGGPSGEPRLAAQLPAAFAPVWSPDGASLLFASDVYPECGAAPACNRRIRESREAGPLHAHVADRLLYRHWTEWRDGRRTHLVVAELASGKTTDVTPGDFDAPPFDTSGESNYAFSPDGREICYSSNHDPNPESSTNADLWTVPVSASGGSARNLTSGNKGYDGHPAYSPDGRFIAYVTQRTPGYESDRFRLAVYDRRAGTSRSLTDGFDNWVADFLWSRDSRTIFFTAQVAGETPLHRVDVATGAITRVAASATVDHFDVAPDSRLAVVARRSVGEPHALWTVTIPGGAWTRLTRENEAVEREVDIRPAEKMTVPGADGHPIQVFVVKPHGFDPSKKYPLILNIHGGPQLQWEDAFRGDWQVYPGAGYVVAFPNPHGSTGFGQQFTSDISGDWGGKVMEDIDRVADALAALPYVDRERMGAMGWSWGGYATMWLEGHTKRYKALASMMGVYDLRAFYGSTEELWFPEWDLKGAPGQSRDYERFSPSGFVSGFATPCLVLTGERDYRIPYTQSLEFFTDLQKRGVPSRLVVFERSGHWPGWYDMVLYYTAHLDWFHRYLGGGEPPWTVEKLLRNEVFR
jgi:dipeptidyl aminopeptidase/acylaminoacyl peptidase